MKTINLAEINFVTKVVLTTTAMLFSLNSKGDQLSYLTLEQATEATEFLNEQSELLLWCGCCQDDPLKILKVTRLYYRHTGYENYYQIYLEGVDKYGNEVTEALDLAYVHFRIGNKAYCVGQTLAYECDPCTKPFLWLE